MAAGGATSTDAKKTRMQSKSYGDEVVNSLSALRQNDELCDFTVSAQGKSLRVHKILLAATSDYFRAMLCGPMKESKEECVDLKGLTSYALEQIIDFIYSGKMELEFDNLTEILNAASHLQVQTALNLCSEYMIGLLTFSNSDEILNIADTYSLSQVSVYYNNKILHNFQEFSKTDQFLKLSASQLARYLADDDLRIKSEYFLYDIVARWYAHDRKRVDSLDSLLKCIRFGLLSEAQLIQLQQHWLTGQFLSGMGYISDGMKYHTDSNMGHPWLGAGAKIRSKESYLVMVHQGTSYRPFEVTAYDHHDSRFYQLATDISGSRDCRIVSVDDFVYICRVVDCGGGTLMNSLLRFDPRHLQLQELTPCRRLRIDPALVAKGHWLYIFGGTNETYAILNSVECYDVRSNTWMDLLPLPSPTHSHAACACGDLIYVTGGVSAPDRQPTANLVCFNPTSHRWDSKSPMHCPRRLHEMVAVGDERMFVLGGIGMHSFHQQTQIPIECYDIASEQWTVLSSTLAGRSVGHFLTLQDNILSIGREHYEATEDDVWLYEIKEDTWRRYIKVPRRSGLVSATCTSLHVNFYDEKVAKKIMSDKR